MNRVSYKVTYIAINEKAAFHSLLYGDLRIHLERVAWSFEGYRDCINLWSRKLPLSTSKGWDFTRMVRWSERLVIIIARLKLSSIESHKKISLLKIERAGANISEN